MTTTKYNAEKEVVSFAKRWKGYGRTSGQLSVSELDNGELWYTNSYYACRVEDGNGIVAKVLNKYNLPLAVGVYEVNSAVRKLEDCEPPRMTGIVPTSLDDYQTITARQVEGRDVLVRTGDDVLCLIMGRNNAVTFGDKPRTFIDERYVRFVEHVWPDVEWQALDNDCKPIVGTVDGNPVAVIMPVKVR